MAGKRNSLTTDQVARVLQALRRDRLNAGIYPLLWRRGWLAPPQYFQPFYFHGLSWACLMTGGMVLIGLGQIGVLFALMLFTFLLIGVARLETQYRVTVARGNLLIASAAIVAVIIWLVALHRISWLSSEELFTIRDGISYFATIFVISLVVGPLTVWWHAPANKLPPWRDYVAAALVAEVF